VLLVASACYALDRVKLRDSWIDPADVEGQPERYGFLSPHAPRVRLLALLMLGAGAALGARASAWALAAAALAPVGVALYAPRGRSGGRARLKDRVWLKNTYVGGGIAAFAVLATAAEAPEILRERWLALGAAGGLVFGRAALDAALCDIDDEATDRRHGTATLATWLGGPRLWRWSVFARAALAVAVLAAWPCPLRARLAWGLAIAAGTVALRVRPPRRVRDWVDARFLAEAVVATGAMAVLDRVA
jgi:4-hydroxybenzoate polyprenyltransferase